MDENITESEIKDIAIAAQQEITPVNKVESALSDFVKDTFEMVNEDYKFNRLLRDELVAKMQNNELNASQMVMLYTTDSVNISDRMSKTLSPLMQLLTAKQQAEMAKTQKETATLNTASEIKSLNQVTSNEVLSGLKTLFDMARSVDKIKETSNAATVIPS